MFQAIYLKKKIAAYLSNFKVTSSLLSCSHKDEYRIPAKWLKWQLIRRRKFKIKVVTKIKIAN